MIDMNKQYVYNGEYPARIICVDAKADYPVIALINYNGTEQVESFTLKGYEMVTDGSPSLVEVNPFEDYKVDEPVMVKSYESSAWVKRHFAKYHNGDLYCWEDGCTSWTASRTISWAYYRKPTKKELSKYTRKTHERSC